MHNISSPRNDDQSIEQLIKTKGLTAPRVTPEDLEAAIAHVEYVKRLTFGGSVLRWAVITLHNGFTVTGRPSAAVSPANDDQEVGERVALANAKNEMWPLLGYALKERLSKEGA